MFEKSTNSVRFYANHYLTLIAGLIYSATREVILLLYVTKTMRPQQNNKETGNYHEDLFYYFL